MTKRFDDLTESIFKIQDNAIEDKVMSLEDAIKSNVKPGTKIHIGTTHCCSGAAILEIARQFHGQKPDFTLIMRGIRDTVMIWLHLGLVKKVITTFSGNVYPWYRPNPIAQNAYVSKDVELEDWSILTFPLMLLAGAMGVGFMPTRSILGSNMAEDNKDSFKIIDDPFGGARKIGLLKALNPDISIVHGLAADREGNTLLTPPYSESVWGAKASKGGALVTVENLVSTKFIREHSHLVKLPGYMVKSVSLIPFGAHPNGVWNQGAEEFEAYADDYTFMTEFNEICRNPAALDGWIKEWVLDCSRFEDYISKLGPDRISFLKSMADSNSWRHQLDALEDKISESREYSPTEMMVVVASREIIKRIARSDYKTILSGAGTANLAAWMAKYQLQREHREVELMVELGYYGSAPRPAEPFLLNFGNFASCKMLTETIDTLGVFTSGSTNQCIGVLGGGQVDKYGNINSTWISNQLYLTGSGGANDVASGAREVVLIMLQSPRRFVERVPYITCPGAKVKTLVSSMGVFEKANGEEFNLTKYFASPALSSKNKAIDSIKENCGWELIIAPDIQEVTPPTLEELRLLRVFDPNRYYLD
ncbi:MAG: CoA-transferase [Candidatus Thorarchaeota archaeon]|jgi:acyl CoA:acetate/3-ketoacid CoA transferase alpha subunit/acyl CoA:acetate/3-ketoacid CoA transferase beta subunit